MSKWFLTVMKYIKTFESVEKFMLTVAMEILTKKLLKFNMNLRNSPNTYVFIK